MSPADALARIMLTAFQYIIPNFMLCPTTSTLIGLCIAFLLGIIRLNYFMRDAPFIMFPWGIWMTIMNIEWSKGNFLVYFQMFLPINIWIVATLGVLFHPFFLWIMPVRYGRWVEDKKKRREEREVARIKRKIGDIEVGQPPGEVNEEASLLTGRGFTRNTDGAYVENPRSTARVHDLYEEIRS
jgi:hypothetical protein